MAQLSRRTFIKAASVAGASAIIDPPVIFATGNKPPNIVMIAVDDLNYDSITWLGGRIPGLTPYIDRLASQGMRFTQAYSRCAPSRGSMMTGLYQDRYSDEPGTGSTVVREGVTPLPALLKQKPGYRTAVLGKETHYKPAELYDWDAVQSAMVSPSFSPRTRTIPTVPSPEP